MPTPLAVIARLQKLIALTWLGAALVWLLFTVPRGRWLQAALGLLVLALGHAAVLGLEFLLAAKANRQDPTERATVGQRLRAWWSESLAAPHVFLWRQPFCSRRWPDRLSAQGAGRRGVLLVHGFVCNRGVWNAWLERLTVQGVPFVAVNLEPVFGSIDSYPALIEDGVARLQACTGRPPLVVAHSMGGLAVRRWYAAPGHAARVQHVLTLGTPHHGTWLARWAFVGNGLQMRQGGTWLADLRQREAASGVAAPFSAFTCFYSHCDNIVFPARTATLPGADNRHLPGMAHVQMVDAEAPWLETLRRLAQPE